MSVKTPLRALVVGGTGGIGQGIAMALARRDNIEVTIAGRSVERGEAIVRQMNELTSSDNRKHKFVPVDAFDLSSVKKLADVVDYDGKATDTDSRPPPDILVLTQGMATIQGYTPTTDGLDQKLQLHYFSRIYLARMLAPKMPEGGRIMTVLSAGVHGKYDHYHDDFELKTNYSIKNAADAAGFYTDAGFERLSEDYPHLCISHAAPGFVNTNWGSEMPWLLRTLIIRPSQALFGKNLNDVGETITNAMLDTPERQYTLIDHKGEPIIPISAALRHTQKERDAIWHKTLEVLPDL